MIKSSIYFGFFGLCLASVACGSASPSSTEQASSVAGELRLDVRCSLDADCPAGFQCEVEVEHGVSTSYCKSHKGSAAAGTAGATCPAGFEAEVEHGRTTCKPHGGTAAGTDDDAGASTGGGGGGGGAAGGSTCATSLDCAAGLECEIEVEHGVTTSTCKPHGGGTK